MAKSEFRTPRAIFSPAVPAAKEIEVASNHLGKLPGDEAEVLAALNVIMPDDYHLWIRIGIILKAEFAENGLPIWDSWSKRCPGKYRAEEIPKRWASFPVQAKAGVGTIFFLAKKNGWNGPSNPVVREMNHRFGILTLGNATRIILKNGDRKPDDEFAWLSKEPFFDRLAPERLPQLEDGTAKGKSLD